jgi:hypothetical protein
MQARCRPEMQASQEGEAGAEFTVSGDSEGLTLGPADGPLLSIFRPAAE